jgi:hypothetical protein
MEELRPLMRRLRSDWRVSLSNESNTRHAITEACKNGQRPRQGTTSELRTLSREEMYARCLSAVLAYSPVPPRLPVRCTRTFPCVTCTERGVDCTWVGSAPSFVPFLSVDLRPRTNSNLSQTYTRAERARGEQGRDRSPLAHQRVPPASTRRPPPDDTEATSRDRLRPTPFPSL